MIQVKVDFDNKLRKMKPLHGVNNGPLSRGVSNDTSYYYKKINPPYARLHDTHYPESREVDVHTVFPDFSKDENDPSNYSFALTDNYIESILRIGTDIIYRLGETIASSDKRVYVEPPSDFEKYARVCVNIIRHYNDGWAGGYHYGIRHWEIWNEPSVPNMWTGTQEQWLRLYKEISTAIRNHDSDILIGGPAACDPDSAINVPFLDYVNRHNLPLDFYTFHCYTQGSEQAGRFLAVMQENLIRYGFGDIPVYITEWNYVPKGPDGKSWWDSMPQLDLPGRTAMFKRTVSPEGASHAAMFMSLLQDSYISQANYYQASPEGKFSFFDKLCMPEKPYYALLAFKSVYDLGMQVYSGFSRDLSDVTVLASTDDRTGRILISNLDNEESEYMLDVNGRFSRLSSVKVINRQLDLMPLNIKSRAIKGLKFKIPRHTVVLIELE